MRAGKTSKSKESKIKMLPSYWDIRNYMNEIIHSEKAQLQESVEKLVTELAEVKEKCEELRIAKQVSIIYSGNSSLLN